MLAELAADLRGRGLRLAISNPSERVQASFERSGLDDAIGARQRSPHLQPASPTETGLGACRVSDWWAYLHAGDAQLAGSAAAPR